MHSYKKYWLIAIMIALAAGSIAAQTPRVSLSGDNPSIVLYDNNGTPTWITGSILVTKNYSTVTDITVDLDPKADSPYPRNSNWKYIGPSSDTSIYIDASEMYFSQSTNGNIIKMWGTDSNVQSSNVFKYKFAANSGVGVSTSFNYYAVFWHDTPLAAGTYELPITFRVRNEFFDGRKPNSTPVSTLIVYLKFLVSPSASITFLSGTTGSTATTDIVFDDVAATTTKDFRVSVKSNFRYSLSVRSLTGHGGRAQTYRCQCHGYHSLYLRDRRRTPCGKRHAVYHRLHGASHLYRNRNGHEGIRRVDHGGQYSRLYGRPVFRFHHVHGNRPVRSDPVFPLDKVFFHDTL